MKTINELKESGDYLDEHNNGYYWALKDVMKLINERLNHMIASNIIEDELLYLKARIEGEKSK